MSNTYLHEGLARDAMAGKRVHLVSFGLSAVEHNLMEVARLLGDQATVHTEGEGHPCVTLNNGGQITGSACREPDAIRGLDVDRLVLHESASWTVDQTEEVRQHARIATKARGGDIING